MQRRIRYDPQYDYYDVLGVESHASMDVIQRAYWSRAKQLHPDLNLDRPEWAKEQFQRLNDAYRTLTDPQSRHIYDELRWPYRTYATSPTTSSNVEEAPHSADNSQHQPFSATPRFVKQRTVPRRARAEAVDFGRRKVFRRLHRYLLIVLAGALIINAAFIIGFLVSDDGDGARPTVAEAATNRPSPSSGGTVSNTIPEATIVPTVTLTRINPCGPYLELFSPESSTIISDEDDPLPITGRVQHPDMFTYQIVLNTAAPSATPVVLREADSRRELPIAQGTLGLWSDLPDFSPGSYVIVVTVLAKDGQTLGICSVVVEKT